MIYEHAFWFLLAAACVGWYSTVTIYVAIQGYFDIHSMLRDLQQRDENAENRSHSA